MRYSYLFVFLCVLLFNVQPLVAGPVAVGVTHLPPFYVVEPDGRVSGVLADLIKRTLEEAQLPYVVERTNRLFARLQRAHFQRYRAPPD
ncbi:MAG: hypothetical protein ACI92E_003008 [Oceanicoccus sp.]|jgi:hypothetical protein